MRSFIPVSMTMLLLIGGCETLGRNEQPVASVYKSIPQQKVNSEPRKLAASAIQALEEGRLEDASRFANSALRLDITNAGLQFLNGLIYHEQAKQGDRTKLQFAEQGYELSSKFDPSNWIPIYHRGLLHLEQRKFKVAQSYFSQAALLNSGQPGIFYNLAVASYHAHDPETAAGALLRLRELDRQKENPKVLQASSIVMASLNKQNEAQEFLQKYREVSGDSRAASRLAFRIRDWAGFHERVSNKQLAQADESVRGNEEADENTSDTSEQEPEDTSNKMVIVDVVIIRTEERLTTRKGVNLLNGLTIQFGGANADTAGFSYSHERTSTDQDITRSVVRRLTIPAITYSLNIANSNNTRNEILARPTLVALNGAESEFFSGTNIRAAAVGANEGDSIDVDQNIGVTLKVTPEVLEDGRIKLQVFAERTFLAAPNTASITFALRIDTAKTAVTANVAMDFGDTLILSGLSEKETENRRDGVPGLQDTPLLQYLFSQRDTLDFHKSVLILLTPRPTQYVYQSERTRKKKRKNLSASDRVLNKLQARYSDWFLPYPNWASVFRHLDTNSLYREFRTGDVSLEEWESMESRDARLKQALEFLFF